MTDTTPERAPDEAEVRASEEVDDVVVDIYDDVPEFDTAPWAHDEIESPQDDEAEESG